MAIQLLMTKGYIQHAASKTNFLLDHKVYIFCCLREMLCHLNFASFSDTIQIQLFALICTASYCRLVPVAKSYKSAFNSGL